MTDFYFFIFFKGHRSEQLCTGSVFGNVFVSSNLISVGTGIGRTGNAFCDFDLYDNIWEMMTIFAFSQTLPLSFIGPRKRDFSDPRVLLLVPVLVALSNLQGVKNEENVLSKRRPGDNKTNTVFRQM